jgi:ethanolamine-phosphate cytidylyltransferase
MDHFKVDVVCHGCTPVIPDEGIDPYAEPKRRKKFKFVDSGNTLTTSDLVNRIIENRMDFIRRNKDKEQKECRLIEAMNAKLRVEPDGTESQLAENNNHY